MHNIHFAVQQKLTQHCQATLLQLKNHTNCQLRGKKSHPKSWELYFIWQTKLRTEVWDTASQITLRDCSEEVRGEPGYIQAFTTRLLLIKENPISQVKEFSAFLCMGRCKSLGSLKSFLWQAPQLTCAFSSWVSSWCIPARVAAVTS